MILDDESPFLELMSFAGYGVDLSTQSASVIVGIGLVQYVLMHHDPNPNPNSSTLLTSIL